MLSNIRGIVDLYGAGRVNQRGVAAIFPRIVKHHWDRRTRLLRFARGAVPVIGSTLEELADGPRGLADALLVFH
jgi:hypothetical protein